MHNEDVLRRPNVLYIFYLRKGMKEPLILYMKSGLEGRTFKAVKGSVGLKAKYNITFDKEPHR